MAVLYVLSKDQLNSRRVTTYDVILPAGGTIDPAFAERVGTQNKALIPFEGRTILRRTLDALEGSGKVRRKILVGTEEVLNHPDADAFDVRLQAGRSGPETILNGLKYLAAQNDAPDRVLIVTADLPFLTPEILNSYLAMVLPDADVSVPLIRKESYQGRFPGSGATFIPLRDGTWTAGCVYVVNVAAFVRAMPHLEKVFAVRKSKLGMVKLLGFGFLIKFVTKTLTVPDVERKIRTLLQCTGSALEGAPPEMAYDVDDLEDYEYALRHLGGDSRG